MKTVSENLNILIIVMPEGEFPEKDWGDSIMNSASTFKSYGCEHGDRDALVDAVPTSHKLFLKRRLWLQSTPGPESNPNHKPYDLNPDLI